MTIRSRPATDEYRDGWDRVFGGKPKNRSKKYAPRPPVPPPWAHFKWDDPTPLSPHDAEEHPSAD